MTFDLQNPSPLTGDSLRDHAANLLASKYGEVQVEKRAQGKKVDVYFVEHQFGRSTRVYVEAKDYADRLTRAQASAIWSDYSGILDKNKPSMLLIVTRSGLTPDAQKYITEERHDTAHNTIWELEDDVLGITEYIRSLQGAFLENDLHSYYIQTRAHAARYTESLIRSIEAESCFLFDRDQEWLSTSNQPPLAVLGGYGAGKTSFTKMLASHQARKALSDPTARRPVLIKLGSFSRYSNIEGILGAMFTHDFPVRSFSTRRFLEMNRSGRLLLILDGFDEMKHAMSWSDFRVQVAELKKLMDGDARVLLLGRPSAFLSQEEHLQVLKGRRKIGDDWFKIPDWPDFVEYDIASFNGAERNDFICKYLSSMAGDTCDQAWIDKRVAEVSTLANLDEDIFSKPVHAKILTELALDPSIDLSKFKEGVSRWQLYELFFGMLAEREASKEARREISDKDRLYFLRELAFWLWTQMQGVTAFSSLDIPDSLIFDLPFPEGVDLETKKREYLTGSFLEKKDGDVFYFSHRSFAEFLVAQRMLKRPPEGELHSLYGSIVDDGVESFLCELPASTQVREWAQTLPEARGSIPTEYLAFLAKMWGGHANLIEMLPEESPWRVAIDVIGPSFSLNESTIGKAIDAMRSSDNMAVALLYSIVTVAWHMGDPQRGRVRQYGPRLAGAILDRLFEAAAPIPNTVGRYRVNKSQREALDLAARCVKKTILRTEKHIEFDWHSFAQAMESLSRQNGFTLGLRNMPPFAMIWTKPVEFPLSDVAKHMRPASRSKMLAYFAHHKSLSSIDAPGVRRSLEI